MRKTVLSAMVAVIVLGLCAHQGLGYKYKFEEVTIDTWPYRYIYHYFTFGRSEIEEIAHSYRKAQGYANGMIETIWDLASGMGSDLGKFVGRVWLGDRLYRMANDALEDDWNSMGVQIRSRADEGGKWALEFWEVAAEIWEKLTGRE
jgi:hypothetical protein